MLLQLHILLLSVETALNNLLNEIDVIFEGQRNN